MEYKLTPIEQLFWDEAEDKISGLLPQVWVEHYRVDFCIEDKKVVIELDGHEYHSSKEQRTSDAQRQRFLQAEGYEVIRFTGTEIFGNVQKCVHEVISLVAKRPSFNHGNDEVSTKFACARMQTIATAIADKYDVNLNDSDAYLRLEQEFYQPLVIERVGENLISVSHHFIQNGDICFDPSITFFVSDDGSRDTSDWFPIDITQYLVGWRGCARVKGNDIVVNDITLQKQVAEYAEDWARNIQNNEWIKLGRKIEGS